MRGFAIAMIVNLLMVSVAAAAEITVEPQRVRVGESVTVTITLDGEWSNVREVTPPVRNLELGSASTYSEYRWTGGRGSRTKMVRYTALALRAGTATVGPLVLRAKDGKRLSIPAVSVTVLPELTVPAGSSADELEAGARDRLFVLATADRTSVYAGEPVIVSWHLYALESLRQVRVTTLPKLDDFWVEALEEPRGAPEFVMVGDRRAQRVLLRRSALFPTRPGTLTIEPLGVTVEVLQPARDRLGPFGSWNAVSVDLKRRSGSLVIQTRAVPANVDVIGDVTLHVTPPAAGAGGPVSFDVTLAGDANLRSIAAPALARPIDAELKIEDRGVNVDRAADGVSMTRRWRYVLFPRARGRVVVPPVRLRAFDPRSGATRTHEAGGGAVTLRGGETPAPDVVEVKGRPRVTLPWITAGIALIAALVAAGFVLLHRRGRLVDLRRWLALSDDPALLRTELERELVSRGFEPSTLLRDGGPAGEAWRAVISWIDLRSKYRDEAREPRVLEGRIRELFRSLPEKGRTA